MNFNCVKNIDKGIFSKPVNFTTDNDFAAFSVRGFGSYKRLNFK